MEKKKRRKTGTLRLAVTAVIIVLVILIVVLLITDSAGIRRLWRSMSGKYDGEYYYDNASGGSFASVGGGFSVLSASSLTVFDKSGDITVNLIVSFSNPCLSSSGNYGVAWDLGGYEVILFSEDEVLNRIQTENEIISVSVNDKGYLCLCTDEPGYNGSVTVYNTGGTAIYKWYSGSAYLLSARLRGKSDLLVLTIGSEGSSLVLMKVSDVNERARYTYDGIIIDAVFTDSGITAVSDSELIMLTKNLEERGVYSFSDKHLDGYVMTDSYTVLLTANYIAGERELSSIDSDGTFIAGTVIRDEISSLDAADEYIGVLSGGMIYIYDYLTMTCGSCESPTGTECVLVRGDGTVIAAGSYTASVCGTYGEE